MNKYAKDPQNRESLPSKIKGFFAGHMNNVADYFKHVDEEVKARHNDYGSYLAKQFINAGGMLAQGGLGLYGAAIRSVYPEDWVYNTNQWIQQKQNDIASSVADWNRNLNAGINEDGYDATTATKFDRYVGKPAADALPWLIAAAAGDKGAKGLSSVLAKSLQAPIAPLARAFGASPETAAAISAKAAKPLTALSSFLTLSNAPTRVAYAASMTAPALSDVSDVLVSDEAAKTSPFIKSIKWLGNHANSLANRVDYRAPFRYTLPYMAYRGIGLDNISGAGTQIVGSLMANPTTYDNYKWLEPKLWQFPGVSEQIQNINATKPNSTILGLWALYDDYKFTQPLRDVAKHNVMDVTKALEDYWADPNTPKSDKLILEAIYSRPKEEQLRVINRIMPELTAAIKPTEPIAKILKQTLLHKLRANRFVNTEVEQYVNNNNLK